MRRADERDLRIAKNSTRNGFVVASALLLALMEWQFLHAGGWTYALGPAFFLSQLAYWGSMRYSRGRNVAVCRRGGID